MKLRKLLALLLCAMLAFQPVSTINAYAEESEFFVVSSGDNTVMGEDDSRIYLFVPEETGVYSFDDHGKNILRDISTSEGASCPSVFCGENTKCLLVGGHDYEIEIWGENEVEYSLTISKESVNELQVGSNAKSSNDRDFYTFVPDSDGEYYFEDEYNGNVTQSFRVYDESGNNCSDRRYGINLEGSKTYYFICEGIWGDTINCRKLEYREVSANDRVALDEEGSYFFRLTSNETRSYVYDDWYSSIIGVVDEEGNNLEQGNFGEFTFQKGKTYYIWVSSVSEEAKFNFSPVYAVEVEEDSEIKLNNNMYYFLFTPLKSGYYSYSFSNNSSALYYVKDTEGCYLNDTAKGYYLEAGMQYSLLVLGAHDEEEPPVSFCIKEFESTDLELGVEQSVPQMQSVYKFTPSEDGKYSISLKNKSDDGVTGIQSVVYDGTYGNDACSFNYDVYEMQKDITYYIYVLNTCEEQSIYLKKWAPTAVFIGTTTCEKKGYHEFKFTPEEDGDYVIAITNMCLYKLYAGDDLIREFNSEIEFDLNNATAGTTYTIEARSFEDGATLNIKTITYSPLTLGDNEIEQEGWNYFSFTPEEDGNYVFNIRGFDGHIDSIVSGEDVILKDAFSYTLEAGKTYKITLEVNFAFENPRLHVSKVDYKELQENTPVQVPAVSNEYYTFTPSEDGEYAFVGPAVTIKEMNDYVEKSHFLYTLNAGTTYYVEANNYNEEDASLVVQKKEYRTVAFDDSINLEEGYNYFSFTPNKDDYYKFSFDCEYGSDVSNIVYDVTYEITDDYFMTDEEDAINIDTNIYYLEAGRTYYICICSDGIANCKLGDVCKSVAMTGNHDFSKQPYQVDEDGKHYQKCKDCGAESTHEVHIGGTATCKAKAKCTVCGKEYGSLAAHTYATKWSTDATNHWHACTVCEAKKDSAAHADSNKDGKCDTCLYNMHSHSGTKVAQADATCTSYGVKAYYKCSCGKYYTDSACTKEITDLAAWKSGDGRIAKKAHTLKTTTTKATLKANGKKETKCSVCGQVTKTETIYAAKTIKLSTTKYTYNGKVKKPSVTIKDSKGNAIASSGYTVTYPSGRKNVGKYTVKVTFKGNYSGSKSLTFIINPPKTSISKVTAGKKAFTVKWAKKTTQVTGYEIQYSTSSTFKSGNKTVKVTSAKTASKTIKSLKAKKKYYVRIRTYKTVKKVKYYSDWSAKKSVTTKK